MKTATLCATAFLLVVSSWAFAASVDRDITADYVKANPKEFTVSVTEEANGLLALTVVFTTPDPRYVVAHLVVRDSKKTYATSDTPSLTKNRSNIFHFSVPRDLVATSTFSLDVSGFADSGEEAAPLPGTIQNKLQLRDFVPQKAAGIEGVTFHLSSGEDFLVDKETVIAKLADVVQPGEEKLQGEWRVTGMRVKGQDVKVAELGDGVYIFAKNQLKVTGAAKSVAEMTLRPDSEPKELDLKAIEGVGAGKTVYGLYRFEGEKLVLCIGDVRPSTFSGDDDAGLLVLERFVAVGARRAPNEAAASTLNAAVEKFNEETRFVDLTTEKSDRQSNLDTIQDHKSRQGIESKTLIERGQDHADAVDVGPVRRFVDLKTEKSDRQSNLDTTQDHKLRQGIESKTSIERGQDHADAVDVGPVRRFLDLKTEKSDRQSNLDTIKDHKLRQGIESKTLIERRQDHADAVDVGPERPFVDLTEPLSFPRRQR